MPLAQRVYGQLAAVAVLVAGVSFWWTVPYGEFFSDDFAWLWHGQQVGGSLSNLLTYRISSFYEPVLNALYALLYATAYDRTAVYFLVGLLVHAGVSFLAGVFVYQVTARPVAAEVAVALTAVVGTAYEPVVWVASSVHSIATLSILAAAVCYQRFLAVRSWPAALGTLLCFLLALGTKEVAVVTGGLLGLVLVLRHQSGPVVPADWRHRLLGASVLAVTLAYGVQEYFWQRQAFTVTSGLWRPGLWPLVRLPIVLADTLVPLRPFLGDQTALATWVAAAAALVAAAAYGRRRPLVWFGLSWALVAVLPTIFFATGQWWQPLASRYTYLPRVGAAMALAGAYAAARQPWARRGLVVGVVAVAVWQTAYWASVVGRDYPYVYRTGRSLRAAVQATAVRRPVRVLVAPDRPFEGNPAHVVGAFVALGGFRESDVVFLESVTSPGPGEALLTWDPSGRSYEVRFGGSP